MKPESALKQAADTLGARILGSDPFEAEGRRVLFQVACCA